MSFARPLYLKNNSGGCSVGPTGSEGPTGSIGPQGNAGGVNLYLNKSQISEVDPNYYVVSQTVLISPGTTTTTGSGSGVLASQFLSPPITNIDQVLPGPVNIYLYASSPGPTYDSNVSINGFLYNNGVETPIFDISTNTINTSSTTLYTVQALITSTNPVTKGLTRFGIRLKVYGTSDVTITYQTTNQYSYITTTLPIQGPTGQTGSTGYTGMTGPSYWQAMAPTVIYYNGGNVGIGKTTASYTLDVSGNMRISNGNKGSDGLTILHDPDRSALEIRKYTSDPSACIGGMLIASNNNYNNTTENNDFLIVSSGPSQNTGTMNLTVWANETLNNGLRLTSSTATLTETGSIYLNSPYVGIGQTSAFYSLDVSGNMRTTSTTYLATTSGNVGIGDTTPDYKLDVNGNMRTTSDTYLATTSGKVAIGKTTAADGYALDVLGNVNATSYNSTSDYRIKENVKQLDSKFIVDKLNPVTYLNNNLGKQDIGLIAHELQEIFPELVNGEKDGEQLQSVNYTGLIPILIKELKELKKEMKYVKTELNELKNKIDLNL